MSVWISRNEAADILNVNPQSISNYIESGFLEGRKLNNLTQVSRESVDIFLKKVPHYSQRVDKLEKLDQEIKCKTQDAKDKLRELNLWMENVGGDRDAVIHMNNMLVHLLQYKSDDQSMLGRYINGETVESISSDLNIRDHGVRRAISDQAEQLMTDFVTDYLRLQSQVESLTQEVKSLSKNIYDLNREVAEVKAPTILGSRLRKSRYNIGVNYADIDSEEVYQMRLLLSKPITEFELPTRIENGLKGLKIKYIKDLVQYNKTEILRLSRGQVGKKSLEWLDNFLESLDLTFGMDISRYGL